MQDPTRAGAFWPGEQYEKIYRYCYFRLGSRERAEDATQEAFCRWLEHGGAQQDPLTALKYLYTVARNLCADEARRPRTVPLDAPTAGLDPKERVRFRELISGLGQESIVLLSTHIVSDVAHIADRLLMMKDGRLVYEGRWTGEPDELEAFYLSKMEGEDHA